MNDAFTDAIARAFDQVYKSIIDLEKNQNLTLVRLEERLKIHAKTDYDTHLSIIRLEERLKELEEWTRADEDRIYERLKYLKESCNDHDERIDALEEMGIEQRLLKLESHFTGECGFFSSKKNPHKCPVCDGNKRKQVFPESCSIVLEPFESRIIDSKGNHFIECEVCQGKGVLWK